MFDTINGLPLHPLVVHAVVVLLPLATIGTLAICLRRPWRLKYGPLVVLTSLVSCALVPVATSSGESLERSVGDPGQHAALGDQLIIFALALLITSAALVGVEMLAHRRGTGTPRYLNVLVAAAVIASVACSVQVIRVGDSGARAAWGDKISTSSR